MQDAKPDRCCQSLVLHSKHTFGIRQQDILQVVLKKSPPTPYHDKDKCKRIRQKRKWKTWVLPTPYRYNFTLTSPESVALIYLHSDTGPWEGSTGSVWERRLWILPSAMIKVNLGTSESNQSISPVVFIQRERERPEDGGKDGGKRQTVRGWREAENLLCFQTSSSSLLPLLFYLSSLFLPPCLPVASCWDSHLLGNKAGLGRESPASPQLYHTGIGEMCSWLWVSYLYYLLDYKKQVAFSYCALSLLSSVRHTWLDLSSVQFVSGHSRYFQYLSDIFPSY